VTRRRWAALLVLPVAVGAAAACGGGGGADDVVLMAHDSFTMSDSVLAEFERESGLTVRVLKQGDAGVTLNQAILAARDGEPLADALFGVDNTFLTRALDEDVFEPYESAELDAVDPAFVLDDDHRVTPVDFGDICLNYDTGWFGRGERPAPPRSLDDLVDPAYRDLTVVQDPAQSSPGLGFLLATIAEYGEDGWEDYWRRLRDNGVRVDNDWEQAYNGSFSVNGGDRPIVVSYASSPPADVVFADPPKDRPAIEAVLTSCFRQVEFVGVLRGADNPDAARELVDFMLTERFQADVPQSMFVYPVRRDTPLPEEFTEFGPLAPDPHVIPPDEIGEHREEWIEAWGDVMQR
jgi:thiamine transport system substrate-binding protein